MKLRWPIGRGEDCLDMVWDYSHDRLGRKNVARDALSLWCEWTMCHHISRRAGLQQLDRQLGIDRSVFHNRWQLRCNSDHQSSHIAPPGAGCVEQFSENDGCVDSWLAVLGRSCSCSCSWRALKLEFHDTDTDTDILARILADTSDTRDWRYSCGKLNDTPTFLRRSPRGCRCRRRGMRAWLSTLEDNISNMFTRGELVCGSDAKYYKWRHSLSARQTRRLLRWLSVTVISLHQWRLSVKLLVSAQRWMWSSSARRCVTLRFRAVPRGDATCPMWTNSYRPLYWSRQRRGFMCNYCVQ